MPRKLYQHVKTGGVYELLHRALMEADAKTMAVVYTEFPDSTTVWVRPEEEFMDGRFKTLGEAPDVPTFDPLRDIQEFHQKFDLEYTGPPRALPQNLYEFRHGFIQEELGEYGENQGIAYDETTKPLLDRKSDVYDSALEEVLDAFVDLMYVTLGTSYLHGMNDILPEAWARVHAANMAKVRADLDGSNSKRDSSFDVVKPAGWVAPSHEGLMPCTDLFEPHRDRA